MTIENISTLVAEIGVLLGVIIPVIASVKKIKEGVKSLLRSEMLRIYYANCEKKTIHQYEYENFSALYSAYTALHGNSFIEKIFSEIKEEWEVIR